MNTDGSKKQKHRNLIFNNLSVLMAVYDFAAVHFAYFLALWSRFDFIYSRIPDEYLLPYRHFITIYAVICVVVLWLFRLYSSMWRYAGYTELVRTFVASVLLSAVHSGIITLVFGRMPLSYYFGGLLLQFVLLIGGRFSYRLVLFLRTRHSVQTGAAGRVMVIGAGSAGQMILKDLITSGGVNGTPVCVIDDDPKKRDRYIEGVLIAGGREDIPACVEKYSVSKIFVAIPSASAESIKDIIGICNETGCELRILPGIYQLINGQVTVSNMREVSVEDLLGRDPISTDMSGVYEFIRGKTVLVTGGGGSIGSELCRQIAGHEPARLIILDVYENNAYDIQLELRKRYPSLPLTVLIGSVRDSRRMNAVFAEYRPQIVYHAAAHKHVPLMEDSPAEAVKNNAIGTYKTAYAAMTHGCERFVLISTDKAVNPTNIMGASKRLCEMIIQSFDAKIKAGKANEIPEIFTHADPDFGGPAPAGVDYADIKTEFVAVRFGNVLDSNGSVIPVFRKQIAEGGPVTVTHPDIIRYFMTIHEAVSLVMLAGTYAHGGEIFVLDMGSPVKIDTLARNMIRLSGFKPDEDIKIVYTGLRPGEKLYEEKLMAEEGLRKTENELIHIGNPIYFDADEFLSKLPGLMDAAYADDSTIYARVAELVPTYHPNGDSEAQSTPEAS